MRALLLAAFVIACGTAYLLWQDGRAISYEILLALPLMLTALVSSPRSSGTTTSRRVVAVALALIVVANVALVALGTIPWYAALLALPLLVMGGRELRGEGAPAVRVRAQQPG